MSGVDKGLEDKGVLDTGTANTSVPLDSRVQIMIRQVDLKSIFPKRVGNEEV